MDIWNLWICSITTHLLPYSYLRRVICILKVWKYVSFKNDGGANESTRKKTFSYNIFLTILFSNFSLTTGKTFDKKFLFFVLVNVQTFYSKTYIKRYVSYCLLAHRFIAYHTRIKCIPIYVSEYKKSVKNWNKCM